MENNKPPFALMGARTGNCLRVAVALEVLGIAYEQIKIDLRRGEQRQREFLAINPFGHVPVLLGRAPGQDGFVLTQSNAILLHLCALRPGVLLPREDDPNRPHALERFLFFVTDVIAISAGSFLLTRDRNREGAAKLLNRAVEAIAESERFLTPGPHMTGAQFGLADIAALTIIHAHKDRIAWEQLPVLQTWFDMVMSRDDVRRGLAAFSAS